MIIKPVERVPAPGYPDRYAQETRQILALSRPRRWIGAPLAVVLLSATVAMGLSGCAEPLAPLGSPTPVSSPAVGATDVPGGTDYITMGDMQAPFDSFGALDETFIPLFEYGEGIGAIGCMSITAPVFMSEEEAFAILSAVFAEAGLDIEREPLPLQDPTIPVTNLFPTGNEDNSATKRGDLDADGLLKFMEYLPVEFVSAKDVETWHEDTGEWGSVSNYNIRDAAQTLAENNPGLIVFYDPVALPDMEKLRNLERKEGESDEDYQARHEAVRTEEENEARAQSELLLREQAQALVEWLRMEGVL